MATIKLKFRASSVEEKEGTLYYQVIHKRNVKWISTDYHVFQNEWDEKAANITIPLNGERVQKLLLIKSAIAWELRQRKRTLDRLETSSEELTLNELCEAFSQLPPCKTVFTFLEEQVERQERMQKHGTANTYISTYRRFKEYRQNKDLFFDELTPDMIEEYEAWLANRNQKPNTIRFYLRTLNTLFCKAANNGMLSEERKLFSHVRLSYATTTKRALSEADILALQNLKLEAGTTLAFARDMFMFSFYMRGMPFVDIAYLKKSNLKNGILTYRRKKTNQPLLVEWEQVHQEIVERYAHQTEGTLYVPYHQTNRWNRIQAIQACARESQPDIEETRHNDRLENATHRLCRPTFMGKHRQRHEHTHTCHQRRHGTPILQNHTSVSEFY